MLLTECNLDNKSPGQLTLNMVKLLCKYAVPPDNEIWRIDIVKELIDNKLEVPEWNQEELGYMLKFLCTEWPITISTLFIHIDIISISILNLFENEIKINK